MNDDNGLAALGAALVRADYLSPNGYPTTDSFAAAILRNGAVFLPEGLGPVMVGMAKEIATLRAALDGLAKAAQEVIAADGAIARQEPGADQRWDCALAALDAESDRAAAKEADHD